MTRKKITVVCIIGVAATLVLSGWAMVGRAGARSRARQAQDDLQACRQLQDKIGQLNNLSSRASEGARLPEETRSAIEAARKAANMSEQSLLRITDEPPRPINETGYKEIATQATLRNVTLEELVRFMHHLSAEPTALTIKSIWLRAPQETKPGDRWGAEMSMAYLVFEPVQK
jgi:type II secretory pathway pseudopilin PulG